MHSFIVTDTRHGNNFRTAINGRVFEFEVGAKYKGEQALIDHLIDLPASVIVLDGPRKGTGSSSEEGSVEVEPVPVDPNVVADAKKADARVEDEFGQKLVAPKSPTEVVPTPVADMEKQDRTGTTKMADVKGSAPKSKAVATKAKKK